MRSLLLRPLRGLARGQRPLSTSPFALASSSLHFEDYNTQTDPSAGSPIVIAHGMLGSSANWTSLGKALHKRTGRRVVAYDAVNHGQSPHSKDMVTYQSMSDDAVKLIAGDLGLSKATLVGHSMGGRTLMWTALTRPEIVDRLVVVDISPCNKQFDASKEEESPASLEQPQSFWQRFGQGLGGQEYEDMERRALREERQRREDEFYGRTRQVENEDKVLDATEWDMSHFFHAMLAVNFPEDATLSQARRAADEQLVLRIKDVNLRAWLLMNVGVVEKETGRIGWKNNVQGIYDSFKNHIANFPDAEGRKCLSKTLFLGGSDSEYLPVSDHAEIMELFPDSYFSYIDGAGHWVHSQKPKEFLDALVQFLDSDFE